MGHEVTEGSVRRPAVAGTFYPDGAAALAAAVEGYLAGVREAHAVPKAIIAPHAGYIYSGPVAASAYAPFRAAARGIRRVVLVGPAHRVPFRGMAVSGARSFLTPLGPVPVDEEAVRQALALPGVGLLEAAHAEEHSLEVHLPFLQRLLPSFSLVPVVVGMAEPEDVDRLLIALWGGPETLVVISSDLSHYHDYDTARRIDAAASRAIEMLRPDLLGEEQACGRLPIRGLLRRAAALDLRATAIDLRSSGDTAGPRDRVVGYGAYMFEDAATARLTGAQRAELKRAALASIRHGLERGGPLAVRAESFPRPLQSVRASFVTARIAGRLRGCIGSLEPQLPLIEDVMQNAYKACFADPRFPAVEAEEVDRLEIGISILSTPRAIDAASEADLLAALRPGEDGVVLAEGDRQGLFLPQVWQSIASPAEFLACLQEKAGLARDHWSPALEARRFTAESF